MSDVFSSSVNFCNVTLSALKYENECCTNVIHPINEFNVLGWTRRKSLEKKKKEVDPCCLATSFLRPFTAARVLYDS